MEPTITLGTQDWIALGGGFAVMFLIGFFWYNPKVFGKAWMRAEGYSEDWQPPKDRMMPAMVMMFLGAALQTFVFYTVTRMFLPDTWYHDGAGLTVGLALQGAFFTFIGFQLPLVMDQVGFAARGWGLLWIHGGYRFVTLVAQAMVFLYALG